MPAHVEGSDRGVWVGSAIAGANAEDHAGTRAMAAMKLTAECDRAA